MSVILPSGREFNSEKLGALTRREIEDVLPHEPPEKTAYYVMKRGEQPEGFFPYGKQKDFVGPAVVLYPSGHYSLMFYQKNRRSGVLAPLE